jgi:hypothetical protein
MMLSSRRLPAETGNRLLREEQVKMVGKQTSVKQRHTSENDSADGMMDMHHEKNQAQGAQYEFDAEKNIRAEAQQIIHERIEFNGASGDMVDRVQTVC